MVRPDIGDRLATVFDALEEVLHVIARLLAFAELDDRLFDFSAVIVGQVVHGRSLEAYRD